MFSSSVSSRNVLNSKLTVQHDTAVSVVSFSPLRCASQFDAMFIGVSEATPAGSCA